MRAQRFSVDAQPLAEPRPNLHVSGNVLSRSMNVGVGTGCSANEGKVARRGRSDLQPMT